MSDALDWSRSSFSRESGIRVQPAQHGAARGHRARGPDGDPAGFLRLAPTPSRARPRPTLIDEVTVKETFFSAIAGNSTRSTGARCSRARRPRAHGDPRLERRLRHRRGGVHARAPRVRGLRARRAARPDPRHGHLGAALAAARAGRYRARSFAHLEPPARPLLRADDDQLVVGAAPEPRHVRAAQPGPRPRAAARRGGLRPDPLPERPHLLRRRDDRPRDRGLEARSAGGHADPGPADVLYGSGRRLVRLESIPARQQSAPTTPIPLRKPLGVVGSERQLRLARPRRRRGTRFSLQGIAELESGEAFAAAESLAARALPRPHFWPGGVRARPCS